MTKIIRVSELIPFLKSDLYRSFDEVPITHLRALSQNHNPRAADDDVALIIAYQDNKLLSYIGLLPDVVFYNNKEQKVWWNSCWWANEKEGQNGAMQLFYQACKLTNGQFFFPELTPHTRNILKQLKIFQTVDKEGLCGYLKLNFADVLPSRKSIFKQMRVLLDLTDQTINFVCKPVICMWEKRLRSKCLEYRIINQIDDETKVFIGENNQGELFRRNQTELNWILNYPWVTEEVTEVKQKYAFSFFVNGFKVLLVKIYETRKMVGFFILLMKNGNAKLTYCYYNSDSLVNFTDVLFKIMIDNKIKTFVTFNTVLMKHIRKYRNPFILMRKQIKTMAFPASFSVHADAIQDGDGDCAFV